MIETKQIAILTIRNDIHALAIQKEFENYKDVRCSIIETDQISNNTGLCWSNHYKIPSTLPTREREHIKVREIDLIWWRRVNYSQKISSGITDLAHIDLINRECRETLFGLLYNEFRKIWINDPVATQLAENKLIQLSIAKQVGFRVPITLISNDPVRIRKFCSMLNNKVIIKPVKGTHQCQILTTKLRKEHLLNDDSISLCPAIYQEYIEGTQHIRAHCFGDEVYAAVLESNELDWRSNLDIPFRTIDLHDEIKEKIRSATMALGLRMGIFDLKYIDGSVSPVWLEINPQGQFLFVEGLTGLNLTKHFAEFLYNEAKAIRLIK